MVKIEFNNCYITVSYKDSRVTRLGSLLLFFNNERLEAESTVVEIKEQKIINFNDYNYYNLRE